MRYFLILILLFAVPATGCDQNNTTPGGDNNTSDTDSDSVSVTDSLTDSDTEPVTNLNTDNDTYPDTNTDTDTDTNIDTNTETDSDINTDGDVPAVIENYPWPDSADLKSDKYTVRVRGISKNGLYSPWQELFTFNNLPRNYEDKPITGGDGCTDFLKDRTMSFVQFAFDGRVEVEVEKQFGTKAARVDITPRAFGINPTFFDGRIVRFELDHWRYVSVDFESPDNRDDDRYGGDNIKNGMMVFADLPETTVGDYDVPNPDDKGVVVWDNNTDISVIRNAQIIYFPPGDHKMKEHKDNESAFLTDKEAMLSAPLYHGQLRLNKTQKIYLAGGAYVRGAFKTNGYNNVWLYGRGIVSGRDHLMHEILIPDIVNGVWQQTTQTKEAFVDFIGSDDAYMHGVVIMEPFHHTCPSGKRTNIKNIKILGYCSNNDGIRPGEDSVVDGIFIKTSDDYDYARSPHTVTNSVFWPGVNGAVGMLGWNNLGTGYAKYRNNYIINAEWSSGTKRNTGVIGSVAAAGIKLQDNLLENIFIENPTTFLVNATIEGTSEAGWLKNFLFKNIKVEYPFQLPNGTPTLQRMEGTQNNPITGFTFTNLIVDGVLVNWNNYRDYFDLNLTGTNGDNEDTSKNVFDITFDSEDVIYKISVSHNEGGSFHPTGHNGQIDCPAHTTQQISILPRQNQRIENVIVDGESKGRIQVVLFKDVTSNHTVEINFEDGTDYF